MQRFDRELIGTFPRPDFRRDNWVDLNGQWDFDFDDENRGLSDGWQSGHEYSKTITVPFCYQAKLSSIHDLGYHPYVWYRKTFQNKHESGSTILHFGAVDYRCKLWINKQFVGQHIGGHTSFCFDITEFIQPDENEIVLWVEDTGSCEQPRGKQVWGGEEPMRCWYTPTTGIWQNVWLEHTGECHADLIHITPDIDRSCADMLVKWSGSKTPDQLRIRVWREETLIVEELRTCFDEEMRLSVTIPETDPIYDYYYRWSPKRPTLYDVEVSLLAEGKVEDTVCTYFGMRKIECRDGLVILNTKPIYQKLILDQGYWPDSLITPPDSSSLRKDLELIRAMGFNGVRKHQKIEDPRFYYWADVMGLLVWEEMPSSYKFTQQSMEHIISEWTEAITRDYNHPCVITWVPFNESWGVRDIYFDKQQQSFAAAVYNLTKALDSTRLVNTNDGWEQIEQSDYCTIHDYRVTPANVREKYRNIESLLKRDAEGIMLHCKDNAWQSQPIILSEFGGISLGNVGGWGYNKNVAEEDVLIEQYRELISGIRSIPEIQGYCWTQFTDVMQEMNGLLYADHTPKLDVKKLAACNV